MFSIFAYLADQNRFLAIFGIIFILFIAFLFSANKRKIKFGLILKALLLQFVLAFFVLKTSAGHATFKCIASGFTKLYSFASAGTEFVFGKLADISMPWGMIFVVKVVPIIIFFGALMSLLYHLGVIQLFVRGIALVMKPLLGVSGAESLCAVANSMLGQTEAPLLIKNYLNKMTKSEILVVMVSGMATLSGSILAVYGSIGVSMIHMLTASVMAVPGSILISKILIPETELPETIGGRKIKMEKDSTNVLDAISTGTTDGMKLAANVVAMLIAFLSLIALVNYLFSRTGGYSLNDIFAKIFAPMAYLLGIPKADIYTAGSLFGEKLVINEFVAYSSFVQQSLLPRSKAIITYALCGFSNFSCIGIQIGGIGALCPDKRKLLTKLGMTALLGGTLTNFLNAAIASLLT